MIDYDTPVYIDGAEGEMVENSFLGMSSLE